MVHQGRVTTLTLSASVPMGQITVHFAGRGWPLYRDGPGTWQTILFVELDGPRAERRVAVQVLGE